jgi:hypothetical protein
MHAVHLVGDHKRLSTQCNVETAIRYGNLSPAPRQENLPLMLGTYLLTFRHSSIITEEGKRKEKEEKNPTITYKS